MIADLPESALNSIPLRKNPPKLPINLMKISKNTFTNEEVVLDFHEYDSCTFTNCRFVVLGYGAFTLNQCEVVNCEFTFAGPAASTIQTMSTIYHNIGEQGKLLIEGTFDQIRNAGAQAPA
jgi:hypothetical protein